jgi:thiol-disulfide isomerase/thioredoxin
MLVKFLPRLVAGLAVAVMCQPATVTASLAAPPAGMGKAIQAYNSRQYAVALTQFEQISKTAPTDGLTHYYMGLCFQGLSQFSAARQQYRWVASYGDASMRPSAFAALCQLDSYESKQASLHQNTVASSTQVASAKPEVKPAFAGRLKVLEFSTQWCHVCHDFEGTWDQVSNDFRRSVDFRQFDAEQPDNASLVQKYGVHAYPTIIYTDDSGKQLARVEGRPTAVQMAQQLHILGI